MSAIENKPYPLPFDEHVKSFIESWKASHPDQEILINRHALRMARYAPNGRHIGFRLVMRVSIEMGGWCAGMYRDLNFIMPVEWENTAEADALINRIAGEVGVPLQSTQGHSPGTAEPKEEGLAAPQARARRYNKSPARAVRISRAARSAMRNGYF